MATPAPNDCEYGKPVAPCAVAGEKPDLLVMVVAQGQPLGGIKIRATFRVGRRIDHEEQTSDDGGLAAFRSVNFRGLRACRADLEVLLDERQAGEYESLSRAGIDLVAGTTTKLPLKLRRQPWSQYPQGGKSNILARAKSAHAEYVKACDAYLEWAADQTRARTQAIAVWARQIHTADPGKWDKRFKISELDAWEKEYRQTEEKLFNERERTWAEFDELLISKELQAQFAAMQPGLEKDELYAELVDRAVESDGGRQHLKAEIDDPDSWMNHKKGIFKSGRKASSAFYKTLDCIAPVVVGIKGSAGAVTLLGGILKATTESKDIDTGKVIELVRREQKPRFKEKEFGVQLTIFDYKTKDTTAGLKAGKKPLQASIELINFALAAQALNEKRGAKEVVGAIGDFSSLADKFVKTAGKKGALGMISGCADMIKYGMDAKKRWDRGDVNCALSFGVLVAGGGLSAAAGFLLIAGITVAPLAAAGAALGLIGTVLVEICDDTPLEAWAEHCRFGQRYGTRDAAFASWVDDPVAQLSGKDGLEDSLFTMKFGADFTSERCLVTITPSVLFDFSTVKVSMVFKRDGLEASCSFRDRTFADMDKYPMVHGVRGAGMRVTSIETFMNDHANKSFDEVDVEVKVDLYSDRKTHLLVRKATLTPSVVERIGEFSGAW